jgi:hypothetical protein
MASRIVSGAAPLNLVVRHLEKIKRMIRFPVFLLLIFIEYGQCQDQPSDVFILNEYYFSEVTIPGQDKPTVAPKNTENQLAVDPLLIKATLIQDLENNNSVRVQFRLNEIADAIKEVRNKSKIVGHNTYYLIKFGDAEAMVEPPRGMAATPDCFVFSKLSDAQLRVLESKLSALSLRLDRPDP